MRLASLIACAGLAACGGRARPYRFASPMLGTASVPPEPLRDAAPRKQIASREPRSVRAATIRVVTAPPIREVSAAGADEAAAIVTQSSVARALTRADAGAPSSELPAPHRLPSTEPLPVSRVPGELRALVGRRDPRDPTAAALAWARDLGHAVPTDDSSAAVIAWAERAGRLHDATRPPERGDLLVFDRAIVDEPADLVAVVIARDERNVTELLYLGGGVIRRGFLDVSRRTVKRDATGTIVNTFLRTGRRWPPKGTRYLAGELLAHVIAVGRH